MNNLTNNCDGRSFEELVALEELVAKLETDMPKKIPLSKMNFSNPVMRSVLITLMPINWLWYINSSSHHLI